MLGRRGGHCKGNPASSASFFKDGVHCPYAKPRRTATSWNIGMSLKWQLLPAVHAAQESHFGSVRCNRTDTKSRTNAARFPGRRYFGEHSMCRSSAFLESGLDFEILHTPIRRGDERRLLEAPQGQHGSRDHRDCDTQEACSDERFLPRLAVMAGRSYWRVCRRPENSQQYTSPTSSRKCRREVPSRLPTRPSETTEAPSSQRLARSGKYRSSDLPDGRRVPCARS